MRPSIMASDFVTVHILFELLWSPEEGETASRVVFGLRAFLLAGPDAWPDAAA